MSTTDELRTMLDERGVEWTDETVDSLLFKGYFRYTYWGDDGGCCFCEPVGATPGTLAAKCDFSAIDVTPAQAITATMNAGESRWFELFGTPERAARTLLDVCDNCGQNECSGCQVYELTSGGDLDYDALLEWLRGES